MPVSSLRELNPFSDEVKELRDELNDRLREYNDYHRDAEVYGTVYVGPNGFSTKIPVTVTTATTLDDTHRVVVVSPAADITVTLPAVATSAGYEYYIKNTTDYAVTIDGNASDTIDGQSDWVIHKACLHICCDGSAWWIIGVVNGAS